MADELAALDATAQADLVRTGRVSAQELVEVSIARIERIDPQIHAIIAPRFEKARREMPVAGPFHGVPLLLKDILGHSAGDPFAAGMRFLRELRWTEDVDTYLVRRFRQAGFVCVGRTNVPELGLMPTTEPEAFGPTRNPWDPARSPGGSSGGSAAAVAAGLVPVAHANDGGGSIRIPASACGLVGLKPSRGRTSLGPDTSEMWAGMVVEGVVSRSVRDTAAVLDGIAGLEPGDPYGAPPPVRPWRDEVGVDPGRLRVGILTRDPRGMVPIHPDCVAAANEVAALLGSLGHRVEESWPESLVDDGFQAAVMSIVTTAVARELDVWSERTGRAIGPADVELGTWMAAEMGRSVSARDYLHALAQLHAQTRRTARWWADGFDVLLTPTLPEPPPVLGTFASSPDAPMRGLEHASAFVVFTIPFNVTGQPAVSLPLYWNADGLPIGVQLVAAYGREDLLIRLAAQLEAARPWANRRPRIHA